MKFPALSLGLLCTIAAGSAFSQTVPAQWPAIDRSMTALLDDGWRIASHSSHFEQWRGESVSAYSFVLTKDGKSALCLVDNPGSDKAGSRCHALN